MSFKTTNWKGFSNPQSSWNNSYSGFSGFSDSTWGWNNGKTIISSPVKKKPKKKRLNKNKVFKIISFSAEKMIFLKKLLKNPHLFQSFYYKNKDKIITIREKIYV